MVCSDLASSSDMTALKTRGCIKPGMHQSYLARHYKRAAIRTSCSIAVSKCKILSMGSRTAPPWSIEPCLPKVEVRNDSCVRVGSSGSSKPVQLVNRKDTLLLVTWGHFLLRQPVVKTIQCELIENPTSPFETCETGAPLLKHTDRD